MSADSHGDDDTLAHTAGKLMWICVHSFLGFRDADKLQGFNGFVPGLFFADLFMFPDHFHHLVADLEYRIEGSHRVLEDHAVLIAAELFHLCLGEIPDVHTVEDDGAIYDLSGLCRHEPHHGGTCDALSGTGLTDDPHGRALTQAEAYTIDGLGNATRLIEICF